MGRSISLGALFGYGEPEQKTRQYLVTQATPSLSRPVSQACTADQFREPAYDYWCEQIREAPRFHRKQWEFCYIAQALACSGVLAPGRRGLGFGVGNEPLAAIFASRGARILATDLAPEEASRSGWVETEQHAYSKASLNGRGVCDPERFNQLADFRVVDMNDIPGDLGRFDFIWSACAFEHLGSIENGCRFIMESSRLLAPGGVAVHTTELNCSSDDDTLDNASTVLYRRRDMERMAHDLAAEGFALELTFELGDTQLDAYVDIAPYSPDKHLKLQFDDWVTTSFGLMIKRPCG